MDKHKVDTTKWPDKVEFWCDKCDGYMVDSTKPETGSFYYLDGHIWRGVKHKYGSIGESVMIIHALCHECDT